MKKHNSLSKQDIELFRSSINGTCQLKQDTVFHPPQHRPVMEQEKHHLSAQIDNSFYFSDSFQPYLNDDGPTHYLRADTDLVELKNLRRGDYTPKFFLDLHGLTQHQAKQELGALIAACQHHQISCACVMHGYGKQILKQQIPLWLAQHPLIRAFHQASRQWGGSAALLILIETDQREKQR